MCLRKIIIKMPPRMGCKWWSQAGVWKNWRIQWGWFMVLKADSKSSLGCSHHTNLFSIQKSTMPSTKTFGRERHKENSKLEISLFPWSSAREKLQEEKEWNPAETEFSLPFSPPKKDDHMLSSQNLFSGKGKRERKREPQEENHPRLIFLV